MEGDTARRRGPYVDRALTTKKATVPFELLTCDCGIKIEINTDGKGKLVEYDAATGALHVCDREIPELIKRKPRGTYAIRSRSTGDMDKCTTSAAPDSSGD